MLETRVAPELPSVRADVTKLRRALDNLVRNALEAIGQGPGRVTVTIETEDARGLTVRVDDTGPGLPHDVDVFAPFATTKEHGTGLGLAIARQFVEAHGGRLEASTLEPHGARFRIVLPARQA